MLICPRCESKQVVFDQDVSYGFFWSCLSCGWELPVDSGSYKIDREKERIILIEKEKPLSNPSRKGTGPRTKKFRF